MITLAEWVLTLTAVAVAASFVGGGSAAIVTHAAAHVNQALSAR